MKTNLFNEKTIQECIKDIKISAKQKKVAEKWLKLLEDGKLADEKKGYTPFQITLLNELLGYSLEIEDFEHEKDYADFTYLKEGKNYLKIEVKGTKTDLFKKQNKTNPESPIEQIWRYISDSTPYGIVTNYRKFILFKFTEGNKKYYEFDFLSIKNDDKKLKEFIGIFSKESIDNNFLVELIEESEIQDRKITNDLYKIYHETRLMMIKEFQKNGVSKEEAIHFAQLYLNRLMFIFFAEDINLINKKILEGLIIESFESRISENSERVCNSIKELFDDLNKGSKENQIFGFNGGLFKQEISREIYFGDIKEKEFFEDCKQKYNFQEKDIKISKEEREVFNRFKDKLNPIIRNILFMASFDFKSDINVNILGHIFEQSISDLEGLKGDKESKKKKEGVFYTPEYITEYICNNTIIPYLSKKNNNQVSELIKEYKDNIGELEEKAKHIKILDPACGSGAFLIKATEVLLEIFKGIHEVKDLQEEYNAQRGLKAKSNIKGQITLEKWNEQDEIREIVENNIYGVDINEESVEITKLSLFLKLIKRNKKLPILSNNIKRGNSLIDDREVSPELARDLAFDWNKNFPEIMDKGGFDIVIGNPPYVKARDYEDSNFRRYIEKKYQSAYKMWDLYIPFIEKGLRLLKENGNFSMIIPDTIGKADYTSKIVDLIESKYYLYQIDFFPETSIFEGVGIKNKIIFVKKRDKLERYLRIKHGKVISDIKKLNFVEGKEKYLYEISRIKINLENTIPLGDICLVSYGLRLNSDKNDEKHKFKKEDLLSEENNKINNRLFTEGKYLEEYAITKEKYVEWGTERCPKRLVRATFPELYEPEKLLMSRQKRVTAYSDKGHICDNTIILGVLVKDLRGIENKNINKYFTNIDRDREELETISIRFNLKYLLLILNSNLIKYFLKFNSGGEIDSYPDDWKKIPIKDISLEQQKPFIEKADLMLKLNKEFYEKKDLFLKVIKQKYILEKLNRKLEKFYELSDEDFIKQLNRNLNYNEHAELIKYFFENKKEVLGLIDEISKTEREIDKMVYELYGITDLKEQEIIKSS